MTFSDNDSGRPAAACFPPAASGHVPPAADAGTAATGRTVGSDPGVASDPTTTAVWPPSAAVAVPPGDFAAPGGTTPPRTPAYALSGTQAKTAAADLREPATAADGTSTTTSDVPASRPGLGVPGRDVTPFDVHVAGALAAGGFVDPLGPRLVQPAPQPDPALREPELVWISVPRKGIDRHQVSQWTALIPYTGCGRSTRTGELRPADDPWIVANTTPCPRCWPAGAT